MLVMEHAVILDLFKQLESIFCVLIFIGVCGNAGMLCFGLYYASVLPLFNFKALQMYVETLCITLGLFFMCYWGTEISTASQAVANACYDPCIVGTDIEFQKSLLFIALRCQKPLTFSVGKFTGLSLSIFSWITKNSYSIFMVLRKNNADRLNFE